MILSQINNVQPEQKPISDSTADNLQVSPAIGNTNVIGCLFVRPISLRDVNAFVLKYHRHHKPVVGAKFSIGVFSSDELKGVAICGRPVGRKLDDGFTLEVNRLCLMPGIKNGCSKLYSACRKIAKAMGYKKIITYILMSETGTSLKASGWILEAKNVGGTSWNSSGSIIRTNEKTDLFGVTKKYPSEMKQRWCCVLNSR
jgi:hypothetical protein